MPLTACLVVLGVLASPSMGRAEEWESLAGPHFVVLFKGKENPFCRAVLVRAESYGQKMEQKWAAESRVLESWKNRPCRIYLTDRKEDYFALTHRPPWSKASARHHPEKVIVGRRDSISFLDSELPHEVAHLVFRDLVGLPAGPLPLWVDEGVALMEEGGGKKTLDKQFERTVFEGQWIPFDELNAIQDVTQLHSAGVATFYAQSESLVRFLVARFGRASFLQFCRRLARGTPLEASLSSAYGKDQGNWQRIERDWRFAVLRVGAEPVPERNTRPTQ